MKLPPNRLPEIGIPDTSEELRKAQCAVSEGYKTSVFTKDMFIGNEHFKVFKSLMLRLKTDEVIKSKLDVGLMFRLFDHLRLSVVEPKIDPLIGLQVTVNGKLIYYLKTVGCRVYGDQTALAKQLGCHRVTLTRQLNLMRELGIISNIQPKQWFEFNAHYVWFGKIEHAIAYKLVQPLEDDFCVYDNGTLVYESAFRLRQHAKRKQSKRITTASPPSGGRTY